MEILNELNELDEFHVCCICRPCVNVNLIMLVSLMSYSFSLMFIHCLSLLFSFFFLRLCCDIQMVYAILFVRGSSISLEDFWMLLFGVMCTFSF